MHVGPAVPTPPVASVSGVHRPWPDDEVAAATNRRPVPQTRPVRHGGAPVVDVETATARGDRAEDADHLSKRAKRAAVVRIDLNDGPVRAVQRDSVVADP